jgi:hypothetical protein
MPLDYGNYQRMRVPVAGGVWNLITIPPGAEFVLISMENELLAWRVTPNSGDPLTAGHWVAAGNLFHFEGTSTAPTILYVNPAGGTMAFVSYTLEF